MAGELTQQANLTFNKNGAGFEFTAVGLLTSGQIDVAGKNYNKATAIAAPSDDVLDKGAVGTIGFVQIKNVATAGVPDAPVVTVTTAGTPGSTSNTYVVVANFADGSISVSDPFTIDTSNATLDGTNYNTVAWTDVRADTYDIYRTDAGGTPSTTGLISAGETGDYDDQGAAGDSSPVPDAIESKKPIGFSDASHTDYLDYQLILKAGESNQARWSPNVTDIHRKSGAGFTEFEFAIVED